MLNDIIKKILLIMLPLLITTIARAQQPFVYTQYMDNLTPLNSAYSMTQKEGSIHTLVRKQWVGIPGAPTSYLMNGNLPIESINGSAGLIVSNDVFAIEHLTEVNAFFAKAIKLNENNSLAVSMNAGIRSYKADYSEVDVDALDDPTYRNDVRETQPNIGFGIMFYSNNYYIGASVPELNVRDLGTASQQDNTSFRNHYYFTAGLTTEVNENYKLKYSGLVSYTKDIPVIADLSGMIMLKNTLGLGLSYRTNNEVAGIMNISFNRFYLGYSYQVGTGRGNIGDYSNATHELTFSIRFSKKRIN